MCGRFVKYCSIVFRRGHNPVRCKRLTNMMSVTQEFPLLTCESQATMVADNLVRVSNSHCRL